MTNLWPFACNPLLYPVVMSRKLCSLLVGASYSWGTVCSLTLAHFLSELSFRGNNIINNFVCEHTAIVAVSCSDPYISQEIILVSATSNEMSNLMIILTSYVFIFITVLRMLSTGGHHSLLHLCLPPDYHYHLPWDHRFHLLLLLLSHFSRVRLYATP